MFVRLMEEYIPKERRKKMMPLSLSGLGPGPDLLRWVVCALAAGDHI